MNPSTLKSPVTLSQVAVPIRICYIVPIGAPSEMLTAIFEECHGRWGGRDTLIMPMTSGHIDEKYWAWSRTLDPDIVYSYVPLDVPILERIDHDLMPSVVTVHRNVLEPPDVRPHLEFEARGLPALSLLPMLANSDRLGPARPLALLSASPHWPGDSFVSDSFGINPYGPETVQTETVHKYVELLALGSQATAHRGHTGDREVPNTTALLQAMSQGAYTTLTMAQLCATGYDDVYYPRVSSWKSSWRAFNIVVGDAPLDRIAFWNSRVGGDEPHRRQIMTLRVGESHLDDADFMSALVQFVSYWIPRENGQAFAVVRSSSVADERVRFVAEVFARSNVQVTVSHFDNANECIPDATDMHGIVRPGRDHRYTESKFPLNPIQPRHLTGWGPISTRLTNGSWTVQVTLKRESSDIPGSVPKLQIPRRWQAVRIIAESSTAKATLDGDLRIIVRRDQKPEILSFSDDDAQFVARLFTPHYYLSSADPRKAIRQPDPMYPQTSSAGRHLRGLLNKLGSIRAASEIRGRPDLRG